MGTLRHLWHCLAFLCLLEAGVSRAQERNFIPSSGYWDPRTDYLARCDFNNNSQPFCDWTQTCGTNQGTWIRTKHDTPTPGTGPEGDYPDGKGYFIYQEASNLVPFDTNRLESPELVVLGELCIDFWYHMLGLESRNELKVIILEEGGESQVWSRRGNQSSTWLYGFTSVHFPEETHVKVALEAVRGLTEYGDTAVDNVAVWRGPCEATTPGRTTSTTILTTTTPVPITWGSCQVSGDPHYYTFDKQTHHFMGNCTYTLSQLCDRNTSLPSFNVEAANEHRRGNTRVSYVQSVTVDVHGVRIVLEKGGAVKVNGEKEVVPSTPAPGVHLSSSGFYTVLSADFGLRVKFDGDHQVEVSLPSPYKGRVCGLCGNYNGNPRDDFLNPDGELEADSTSLGHSWQVGNHTSCSSGPVGPQPCTEEEKQVAQSSSFCGLITDPAGPFRHCHGSVDPASHFASCLYDQCELRLDPDSLCKSLQSYTDACQSLGVRVESWRNATFCPVSCPPNSHYESCTSPCPATCVDPEAPTNCSLPCLEACVCDSGFFLNNGKCVPSQHCGCWHGGKHYPVGSEFWADDSCSLSCACPGPGGKVECSPASCPPNTFCGVQNGVPGCYPETFGICRVHNDPHYYTFDRVTLHFMGKCTYTLAKVCANSTSLPFFKIEAKNENRGSPSVSYVQRVLVEVYGQQIEIVKQRPGHVLVNKQWATLPVSRANGSVTVSRSGRYVTLETDFRLTVSYDTDHSVEIRVPTTYANLTCGLCGNLNGQWQDDFLMPDGQRASTANELGNSWRVAGAEHDDPSCGPPETVLPCTVQQEDFYRTDQFCGLLTSPEGPFAACHGVINPSTFVVSCVFDLCALNGSQQALCNALGTYADACQRAGVSLPGWRNATFCPIPCPANSDYSLCASACPATCSNPRAPQNCSKPCVEDCECREGFVLSGGQCVSVADCGCLEKDQYYEKEETFWTQNCERRCRCVGNGALNCSAESCPADQMCKAQNGILGCYLPDTAYCHIYGDPHYITFDGRLYHFQGGCNYTAVETCTNTSQRFSVTTRNEYRWSSAWTALNSVAVSFQDLHIALRKNREVYVNGRRVSPPVNLPPGIEVVERPPYVVVRSPLGFLVKFDGDQELFVQVDERHQGHLCGLCGTYSGTQLDDFRRPDGLLEHDSDAFGNSWRVTDDHWTCPPPGPGPPACNSTQELAFEELCQVVLSSGGPFAACHWSIPPQLYFESCVYDQCATAGHTGQFCRSLGAYAAACQVAGVDLGDWWKDTVCAASSSTPSPTASAAPTGLPVEAPSTFPTEPSPTPFISTPEPGPPNTCDFSCSFDVDFCSWTQSDSDSFDWTRHRGPTPSPTTGPSFDHTTGGGYFIYLKGTEASPGDVAHLLSPPCTTHGPHCFRFWYHMYGVAHTMALRVYVVSGGTAPVLLWSQTGNQGDRWKEAVVSVPHRGRVQILLEGERGEDFRSDIAVDDISVTSGCSGDTTPGGTTTTPTTTTPTTTPVPVTWGSCQVSGDPHYYTFDKQTHHFMGNCTYTLSQLCDRNTSLPSFNVEAANEHRRGNTRVSYVQSVTVDVHGVRIVLEKGGAVKVNGEKEVVPSTPAPGVHLSSSGFYTVLSADFGLRVKFDGDHQVEVSLPSPYKGRVCGLCGNYNGNPRDDFLNPDGELEADSTSLGHSWQVGNHTSCSSGLVGPQPCTEEEKQVAQSSSFCGLITEPAGPFRHCHGSVDPASHFASCLYDQCELRLDPDSLCKSLQSYTDACRSLGVRVESWRNATFCPVSCPPNSHYESCTSPCPATCVDPEAPTNCSLPCLEACVCDSGFFLNNGKCVPSQHCGCWHGGKHYPVGSEFWADDSCSLSCACPGPGGKVECSPASCPPNTFCGVQNGVPGCYPETFGICRVHNDPHYYTFDRVTLHFMGKCTYTLAKVCANSTSLPFFNIEAKNENRGSPSVSYVQRVLVEVYGQQIEIVKQRPGHVLVNKQWTTLPVSRANGSVTVSRSGRYVTLETDFRLTVSYDTDHSVEIRVPTTYANLTCGLCGNLNGQWQDDFLMPDGQRASTANELGNSWRVAGTEHDDPSCGPPETVLPCTVQQEDFYRTDQFCGLLTSPEGPFAACHGVINPSTFVVSCIFDLCALNGSQQALCNALGTYADACQRAGVSLPGWRNATFCPIPCPANSDYSLCASACPVTCSNPRAPQNCSKPCVEDCECREGFVLSGGQCVSVADCGCLEKDQYYEKEETFWMQNCERRCRCVGNGALNCSAESCPADQICKAQNGILGCYLPDTAYCHIYGDPHYVTFDGRLYHFQGGCNYTAVETCTNTSQRFSVTTRNEYRWSSAWTALNSVAVSFQDLHIALRKNREVYVNGRRVSPPVNLPPGIEVVERPPYVVVRSPLGFLVKFDGDQELFVQVDERHQGHLCGLCGTYSGTQLDDFRRPDGLLEHDSDAFGNSWRVTDDHWTCPPPGPAPPACNSTQELAFEELCQVVLSSGGPFAACHWSIPPQLYFESCVYDQCATAGHTGQFCRSLGAYAAACQVAGVDLGDWWKDTVCAASSSTPSPTASAAPTGLPVEAPSTFPTEPSPTPFISTPEPGPPNTCDFSCSFDVDFCSWTQSDSDSFDWTRHRGPTPSPTTGPSFDHTTGGGYFIYLKGTEASPGDVAHLLSPPCTTHGPHCFRFWYHMYGVAHTMALRVYVVSGGTAPVLLWSQTGNQGDRWKEAVVSVPHRGRVQILLEGERGEDFRSDIAVDDISVTSGCSGDTTPGGTTTTPTTTTPTTTPVPVTWGSCQVSGDPHYYTFDKQTHHFMGNCTYTLSQLCDRNTSLPSFNVEAANEHRRGNTRVSYVQSVTVDVHGVRIVLEKGGAVKVNGEKEVVPSTPAPGVHLSSSGFYTVLSADFGLRVKFDGDHQVEVSLPSPYKGRVCGLCGNYNGNPRDDFLNPDGELEADSTSLGHSWQVGNHTSCSSGLVGPQPCTEEEKQVAQSSSFCGLITEPAGPFRHCHGSVDPASHFASCLYDQCELRLDPDSLCKSLQSYTDACRSLGVRVESWRNATFCPVSCPPNSHYESCTSPCPATCVDPEAPTNCSLPCLEACVCDSGFFLNNGKCVPSQHCGCWHGGKHYPVGSEFWADDSCSLSCACPGPGGKVECSPASCPPNTFCGVQNGVPGCYPETFGICRVHNDPHYYTFDRVTLHFMGKCTYTLAKVCANSTSLPFFNIEAKNENRGSPSVSYVQRVLVEVYGQQIEIVKQRPGHVLVNKQWTTLPVSRANGSVTVSRSGRYVTLETDFRLTVSYDTDHSVEIRVPTTYANLTCGLCGNLNGQWQDDFLMPDGQRASTANELGNSWRVAGTEHDDPSCGPPETVLPCTVQQEDFYRTDQFCGLLTSPEGPFAACHGVINPSTFVVSCIFDLCALNGSQQALCNALGTYADACQRAGVSLPGWRNATFCPIPCPANSDYSLCASACPVTCSNPQAPQNCSKPCVEDCECREGFVLSGGQCVSVADCGCLEKDQYYEKEETFWMQNCERRCRCVGNGALNCSAESCPADQICKAQNGILGCYLPDTAYCHIYGDPHYVTFDGRLYHFQGGCNYTAVETCTNTSQRFSVTTRNEYRWSSAWTALNSVAVSFQDLHIALRKNREVYVNGRRVSPPVNLPPGIEVVERPPYVVVRSPLGFLVKFDGDQELFVQVDERHQGHLCGLCGTYSGTQLDDFRRPDGLLEHDSDAFGNSWRVTDDHWTCPPPGPGPPACNSTQELAFEELCQVVLSSGGPFAACHWSIPPQLYFESCVYDQCATAGHTGQFCRSLGAYAAACQVAGVDLGDWWKDTVCAASSSTPSPTSSAAPTGLPVEAPSTFPTEPSPTPFISTPEPGPPNTCDFSCSFDVDFCSWTQSDSDSFDWTRHRGPTPSPTTGPSFDHTTGGGYFIYLKGTEASPGDVAHLLSPPCTTHGPHCFRFWYHMYGVAHTMALRVYVVSGGTAPVLLWSQTGNQGDRWKEAVVSVPHRGRVQILLEGERGEDFRSDIAVDDISVTSGCSGDTTPGGTTTTPTTTTPTTTPVPVTWGSCQVSGDPHYYTFDKQTHHFMGNCTYTLSQLCDRNTSLPSFNVEAANEHRRGNTRVSYVQSVTVDVHGVRIVLEKGGAVKVNGEKEVVPSTPAPGVHLSSSGFYTVLSADFGLRVKFDGDHQVEVSLPSPYKGRVCGLCGNYNGNPRDDFLNPDGELEADSTSLGHSWQVGNHTSCSSGPVGPQPCTEEEKQVAQSSSFCGLITDPAGPFRHCHGSVDPASHFASCLYDQCELRLDPDSLCKSLQSYTDACRSLGVRVESWRNATFCPVSCPPNSHYESCTSPCPATCVDPEAPTNCSLPCLEACVCDSGFFLNNGKCVPSQHCGCWHGGKHYPVGSESWADDSCSLSCACPGPGGKVECSPASCPPNTFCGVQNGVPGCYPETFGICRVHNDPHYYTFDRVTLHFMGKCTYTLAKVCANSTSLPFFNIEAKNENRGSPSVSYVQRVLVEVYGQQIEIVKQRPGHVLVNKQWTTLPVSRANGSVTVSRSGRYVTLETDFRLTVSYDTDHSVEIRVPTTYANLTCGLCGNLNGQWQDDFLMPDGQRASTANELGNSWRVAGAEHDDPSCGPPETVLPCTMQQEDFYRTDQFCGLLTSPEGPFAACHGVINPSTFVVSCVFDLCALNGSQQALCNALGTYADACQRAGVSLPGWRNATFCPLDCPLNTHYEACSTACPATCLQPLAPQNCSEPCVEDCACNAGWVLSGGDCVLASRCGCIYSGQYYNQGETFVTEDCTSHCVCHTNGSVRCSGMACGPEEICKVQGGQRGCFPAVFTTCHVYGDPHYSTFDGRLHHFQGACNYTLVKTCGNTSAAFSITARNEHRGNPSWTALNSVALSLQGLHISLQKGKAVYVNGLLATVPVRTHPGAAVELVGSYLQLNTSLGVKIRFDGDQDLLVSVSEKYQGKLCGLCGTFTGVPWDDFSTPTGDIVEEVNEFGNSWREPDDLWPCNSTILPPDLCPPSEQEAAQEHCQRLTARDGPFSSCHSAIPPQPYLESCLQDACATGGSLPQLCRVLRSYAAACQAAGVVLGDWEAGTPCESCFFNCSFGEDFCEWQQSVADSSDWIRTEHCSCALSGGTENSCNSSGGYYIYTNSDISKTEKTAQLISPGCTAQWPACFRFWYRLAGTSEEEALKVYLVQEGEADPLLVWLASGSETDSWQPAEVDLHIVGRFQILLEGVTGSRNGTQLAVDEVSLDPGCCLGDVPVPSPPSPTDETTSQTTGLSTTPTLEVSSPTATAVTGRATCSASGDPHYTTFDGKVHHFMGICTYTLAQVCQGSSDLPAAFHVSATNELRGASQHVSYINSVHVEAYGSQISLLKNRKVNVNGTRRSLPVFIGGHNITVQISGGYVLLETDFGLGVRFDGNHYVEVSVPSAYKGQLCGLCGNYNQDPSDDNLKPDGQPAGDSTVLGDSWLVPDNASESCSTVPPLECDPELEEEIQRDSACSMIIDPTGIFSSCHHVRDPAPFFENCVYDVCLTGGQHTSLCYGLQAYAESCASAGVCVDWRNATLCSISCPAGSQYKSCGDRCPPSCAVPLEAGPCSPLLVEGCFCEEGFVLSGDRCVPEDRCGCVDEQDQYHELGETWFTDGACRERCACEHNRSIMCQPWECGVQEKCHLQDGVLGCHPRNRSSCHVAGDPHYYTFDKVMHTFLGTCTYTLVTVCDRSGGTTPFTISGRNEDRGPRGATYLREIYVDVYGTRVTLQKNKRVLLNNERVNTPVGSRSRGNVAVGNVGSYMVVETDFGLLVKYDGNLYLEISLPSSFFAKVCGLCGNYNGRAEDELLMPDGVQAQNVTQFGNSWKVNNDSEAGCLSDTREDLGAPCRPEDRPAIEAQCRVLQSSAFTPCHSWVKPELFVQTCVYDMCKYDGMRATLCAIAQAYADACKAEGVTLSWRNRTFCPLPCPSNSHYTPCASPCPPTCSNIYAEAVCEKPPRECLEGCACNEGFVLSDDQCVPVSECGCRDKNGAYRKVGESWVTPHCSQKCRCLLGGVLECWSFGCEAGEICQLKNNGKYSCKPTGFGKCLITGDPHYMTFDGLLHHFQGQHTYVLAARHPSAPARLEDFHIEGENKAQAGASGITFLKELRITVYNHTVLFGQGKKVLLDGVQTVPPAQPHEGLRLHLRATRIYLETDFGLSVTFDGAENSDITLPNPYKKKVEGLCGNFDGKYKNDFTTPDGTLVRDVNSFGESWRVPVVRGGSRVRRGAISEEELEDLELDLGFAPRCSPSQLSVVNSSSSCGLLADPHGPFRACFPHVLAEPFLLSCIFDMCAEASQTTVLCRTLEQYVRTCQEKGIAMGNWREATSCAMQCPPNSQYSLCAPACPASCADLAGPEECDSPCLEGCECMPGYVHSGLDCVPFQKCGRSFEGTYYRVGDSEMNQDCSRICVCTDSSALTCSEVTCAPDEICTIANYTRGCYRSGPCLSSPCLNGGVCVEAGGTFGFYCSCPESHQGFLCGVEKVDRHQTENVTGFIVAGVVSGLALLALLFGIVLYSRYTSRKHTGGENHSLDPSIPSAHAQEDLISVSNLAFEKD